MTYCIDFKILLVISQSARMITKLAKQCGYQVVAIDCFADNDTQSMALETIKIENLSQSNLETALSNVKQRYVISLVLYGSGFENYLDSLNYLEQQFSLIGNPSELVRKLQNKPEFFKTLDRLDIVHPAVCFTTPVEFKNQWLSKPMNSAGGQGIQFHPTAPINVNQPHYWQRYIKGKSYSLLFLANQHDAIVIGYNQQFTHSLEPHLFIFSGIHNRASLPESLTRQMSEVLQRILTIYPLQGLGSLDFIVHDQTAYLLEINPRIPASAQLYDAKILQHHLLACQKQQLPKRLPTPQFAGYQVIYAPDTITIDASINWPAWVYDQPTSGAIIGKNQALCSIIAAVEQSDQLQPLLSERQLFVENLLQNRFISSCNTKQALTN